MFRYLYFSLANRYKKCQILEHVEYWNIVVTEEGQLASVQEEPVVLTECATCEDDVMLANAKALVIQLEHKYHAALQLKQVI